MTSAELRTALQDGSVPRDARVSREDFDGLVSAGDVPELFPRTLTPPPAALEASIEIPRAGSMPTDLDPGDARAPLVTLSGHAPVPDGAPALPRIVAPDGEVVAERANVEVDERAESDAAPSAEIPGSREFPAPGDAVLPSPPPEKVVPTYATPRSMHLLSVPMSGPRSGQRDAEPPPKTSPAENRAASGAILPTVAIVVLTAVAGVAMWELGRPSDAPKPASHSLIDPTPRASASSATTRPIASTPSASASSESAPPPVPAHGKPLAACRAAKGPVKLAVRVARDFAITTAVAGKPERVAIGFSPDGHTGQAISVDATTLGTRAEKLPRPPAKLRRVVPLGGPTLRWTFDVDAPKTALLHAETVAAAPPFQVGIADGALALVEPSSPLPKKLWPAPSGTIDVIEAVALDGGGTWLAVHAGTAIYAGLLDASRAPRGELARISDSGLSAPPSLAATGSDIAIAWASRASALAPVSVKVALGPNATLPLKPITLPSSAGGPGVDATSPLILGLAEGRWLLAWTEGAAGKEQTRALTLSPEGEPIGTAFAISRDEVGGSLASLTMGTGGAGLALYLSPSKTHGATGLWGVALSCP